MAMENGQQPPDEAAPESGGRVGKRHGELLARGFEFRFVASPPRLNETVALYQELGYEVFLDAPEVTVTGTPCDACFVVTGLSRAVYTRRRDAATEGDSAGSAGTSTQAGPKGQLDEGY